MSSAPSPIPLWEPNRADIERAEMTHFMRWVTERRGHEWLYDGLLEQLRTLVVPRVDDAAGAAAAVAATRYPPIGERGLGPSRATGFGVDIPAYLKRANDDLLLAIQVETGAAVDALDSLLEVDGVDMIFVGPGDLGCSLGIDDPKDPELRRIVESIITRSRDAGRLAGVWAANTADAARWRDAGAELVILGSDLIWLARGVQAALAE